VLYEILTGQRMFDGETVSHVLANVINSKIDFDRLPPETHGHSCAAQTLSRPQT
jgi:hypothetical protein